VRDLFSKHFEEEAMIESFKFKVNTDG
jgi:hypothetical protein